MDINTVSSITANVATSTAQPKEEKVSTQKKEAASTGFSKESAVYEKSANKEKADKTNANKSTDRSAIVAQLKADMEAQNSRLFDIVKKTMQGQGQTLAKADDMWKFLAGGNFTVDAETKAQAQADIAEDGYWGVEKTSDRILDFAKALSGDDPSKAEHLLDAFKKGFKEATKTWGKDLPDISSRTYDAVLEKFDVWKNGTTETVEE